jgi:hypothetical protein
MIGIAGFKAKGQTNMKSVITHLLQILARPQLLLPSTYPPPNH